MQSQARLIAASNLELQPLVETMRFRPDLYYRLSMLKFEIPPLRRRKVDIIPLAKKFINRSPPSTASRSTGSRTACLMRSSSTLGRATFASSSTSFSGR